MMGGAERCDPDPAEVCGDRADQDCDGVIDEGCGSCQVMASSSDRNEPTEYLSDGSGRVSLAQVESQRWALFSKRNDARPILFLYPLGSRGVNIGGRINVGSGEARLLFDWSGRKGVLMHDGDFLRALKLDVASMTEVNAEITQGETADEVMVTDGSTMFFSWRDNEGEVMFRAMGISDDAPSGAQYNISSAPYRSGAPSIAVTSSRVAVVFEDEREQMSQPNLFGVGIASRMPNRSGVMLGVGAQPKLLWHRGKLFLASMRLQGGAYHIELRVLDHQDPLLTQLTPTQLIYQSERELELISLKSDGDEVVAIWGERSVDNPVPERLIHVLYLNLEGRPVRGPYQLPPLTFWNQHVDTLYDPERSEVVVSWLKGLAFSELPGTSALEFNVVGAVIDQPCATSNP